MSGSRPEVGSFEDHQLRAVHEGEDQPDLLAVAFRELFHRAVGHDGEAVGQAPGVRQVSLAPCPGEPLDVLAPGHVREQGQLARQVAGPAVGLEAASLRVEPEHQGAPPVRGLQPEEQPDGRCLPRPVRPQVTEHLAGPHFEVEIGQGSD
jgi:hypothetical protein